MRVAVAGLIAQALVISSCSFARLQTLPEQPFAGQTYACDTSRTLPIIDVAVAALATAAFVVVLQASRCADGELHDGCSTVSIGYYYAPIAIGFGWSAGRGFVETGRCRAFRENRLAVEPMPSLPPPPDPALVGSACEPIPGVEHGGRCPRGLVCRNDACAL
jgi:hypothetical protein